MKVLFTILLGLSFFFMTYYEEKKIRYTLLACCLLFFGLVVGACAETHEQSVTAGAPAPVELVQRCVPTFLGLFNLADHLHIDVNDCYLDHSAPTYPTTLFAYRCPLDDSSWAWAYFYNKTTFTIGMDARIGHSDAPSEYWYTIHCDCLTKTCTGK